jgi:hypothetical protein
MELVKRLNWQLLINRTLTNRLIGQVFHKYLSKSHNDTVSTVSVNEYGVA